MTLLLSLLITIVVCVSTFRLTAALFVEQKGDFDWTWRKIGFVQDSYELQDGNILTFSQDSVFALLSKNSGDKLWRVVLPEKETLLDYGADSENLYVASLVRGLNEVIKITNYKMKNGYLGWDAAIKRDSYVHFNSSSHPTFSDMKIDHPTHVVLMISNRVVLVNKNSGLISYQILPQAIKHASGVIGTGSVLLAKLVSNTFLEKVEFMGCITDKSDSYVYDDKCTYLITGTYTIKTHDISVNKIKLVDELDILGTKWLYNGHNVVAVTSILTNNNGNKIQNILTFDTSAVSVSDATAEVKISPSIVPLSEPFDRLKSFEIFSMNNNRNDAKYIGVHRCFENKACKLDVLTRGETSISNKMFSSCDNTFVTRRAISPNVALSVACVMKTSIKVINAIDAASFEPNNADHSKSLTTFTNDKDFGSFSDLSHFRCNKGSEQSNCLWQSNSGRLSNGKWALEEGLVSIRNIEFPRESESDKLDDVDLSFSNRIELQKQSLKKKFNYIPSLIDNIKGLLRKDNSRKVKKDAPFFTNNFAVMLAGDSTKSIRLASVDAFSGEVHWVSTLPFKFNQESIQNSELIVLPNKGKDVVEATIILKTTRDYVGHVTLSKEKITSFSGFSLLDHSVSEIISFGGSHILSLSRDSRNQVFLNQILSTNSKTQHIELASDSNFFHLIDENAGEMKVYSTSAVGNDPRGTSKLLFETASIRFSPSEKIVAKAYIDSSAKVHQESIVAGDDTVMTKYLNPNMVGIVTVDAECTENYSKGPQYLDDESVISPTLSFYLVDSVSGKFIHRMSVKYGSAPVHMVLIENNAVITYWNWKSKRTELLSVAYFDGRLDKYSLNPMASSSNQDIADMYKRSNFTSFKSSFPLAMHKTFILPQSVSSIGSTKTHKGITNKQVLLAFTSGQLYSLSLREINPRRPLKDPTNFEMAEGLMKYSPFVYAGGLNFVTLDEKLEYIKDNNVLIAVKTTLLESSVIVVSHWGGLDTHSNVVTPSQGFDSLSSDFNFELLVSFITGLAIAVYFLKGAVDRRKLKQLWA